MRKTEIWKVEVASSVLMNENETVLVQAGSRAVASKRALVIMKLNGFKDWSKPEKQSLYVRSASFNGYVYLIK